MYGLIHTTEIAERCGPFRRVSAMCRGARVIRRRFIFSGKNDGLTLDFPENDGLTLDFPDGLTLDFPE